MAGNGGRDNPRPTLSALPPELVLIIGRHIVDPECRAVVRMILGDAKHAVEAARLLRELAVGRGLALPVGGSFAAPPPTSVLRSRLFAEFRTRSDMLAFVRAFRHPDNFREVGLIRFRKGFGEPCWFPQDPTAVIFTLVGNIMFNNSFRKVHENEFSEDIACYLGMTAVQLAFDYSEQHVTLMKRGFGKFESMDALADFAQKLEKAGQMFTLQMGDNDVPFRVHYTTRQHWEFKRRGHTVWWDKDSYEEACAEDDFLEMYCASRTTVEARSIKARTAETNHVSVRNGV
jgi:hypothetical protein